MDNIHSVAYELTAAAGASGEATAYTVTPGRKFIVNNVTFVFPVGSGFSLRVWIQRGTEKIIPKSGYVVGDGHRIPVLANIEFEGGSTIVVGYNNTDATESHKALIILEGVLK